ncbi:SRPBCC family protein [Halobellus captivus]|uniref:SRPBCC family protein n=1 Tax=Halobellus captivus TaxID=2592614 RepID=UPI001EEF7933|nr:SRPBCC family protein [Halobellus captivus]
MGIAEALMILEETTVVEASPGAVFHFFETMEEHYTRWHPDHVAFRWIDGNGLEAGATAYFEEEIAGKTQRKTVRFTRVDPDRYIEFEPTSRLVRLLMPHISFAISSHPGGCELTQRISVRTGPIGAWLNRREFDAVREHMREEGENLNRILEDDS